MKKQGVITFKADEDMLEALERIPNKSEFIRAAVLSALDESCPLCGGSGTLNPHQRMHWRHFLKEHTLIRCQACNGFEINCTQCHSPSGNDPEHLQDPETSPQEMEPQEMELQEMEPQRKCSRPDLSGLHSSPCGESRPLRSAAESRSRSGITGMKRRKRGK